MNTVLHYLCALVIVASYAITAFVAGTLYGPELIGIPTAEVCTVDVNIAITSSPPTITTAQLTALYDHAVKVKTDLGWGTGLYCRGLDPYGRLSKVWVVTAAHVVDETVGMRVELIHQAGSLVHSINGTVKHCSKGNTEGADFCLIEPEGEPYRPESIPTISFLDEKPTLGESVWFAGNLDSSNLSVEKGIVASLDYKHPNCASHFTIVRGIGVPGASGSAIFVVRDGQLKLIGLLVAGMRDIETQSWVTQVPDIKDFLASVAKETPLWLAH